MKSILVTGTTGFIASHLMPVLQEQNYNITSAVRRELPQLSTEGMKTVMVGEINPQTKWQKALKGIDTVIHLAARAHILHEKTSYPETEFQLVNNLGTANLVNQAITAGVKHFIFISSIGAMASLSETILTENSPCQPDTPYGRSKLAAEVALINLTQDTQMNWTILRPTLVYGPGNPGNMERLLKLVNKGLPLPFKNINNRRSFLFVGNLVSAITTIVTNVQAQQQTFIITDGEDISTPELIQRLAMLMNKPTQLLPVPTGLLKVLGKLADGIESVSKKQLPINSGAINRLVGSLFVDGTHIQNTLHWHPPYTLEEGLQKTICPITI